MTQAISPYDRQRNPRCKCQNYALTSQKGHFLPKCDVRVLSDHLPIADMRRCTVTIEMGREETHAPQQISCRAFPAVSLVHFSVERPFYKFYGINCRPKLGAKLLDRFFHRCRQISPIVNNLTHRFFNGSQHLLYCNITISFRAFHGVLSSGWRMQGHVAARERGSDSSKAMRPCIRRLALAHRLYPLCG